MKPLITLVAVSAIAGLAACQPGAESTQSSEGGATSAESAATEASASGGDMMTARARAGLWQMTASFPGNDARSVSSRVCMDDNMTVLDSGTAQSSQADDCTQNVTRTGDGFAFTSRCAPEGGGVTETTGTITGDFQTAYRMEATVTTNGAPMAAMNGTSQIVTTAQYQGACPEGWRGGDVELAGMGIRINVNDMREQAAGATANAQSGSGIGG